MLAFSAVLRAVVVRSGHEPSALWFGDAAIYRDMVAALLHGRLTTDAWIWTPGYALCAAPFAALLGPEAGLVTASVVFGLAPPAAILVASRRSSCARHGAVAAMLLALIPEAIVASTRPLSDAVGLGLYVLALLGLEIIRRRHGLRMGILAGIAGGLALLTRSELLVGFGAVAIWFCAALAGAAWRALPDFSW